MAERNVPSATRWMSHPRARHYWDPGGLLVEELGSRLPALAGPSPEVWMLFAPGAHWGEDGPPEPAWWRQPPRAGGGGAPLDPEALVAEARTLGAAG